MQNLLTVRKSSFVAVTGRRRVGKTFLIDSVYEKHFCLSITGIQDADISTQIRNFAEKLSEYSAESIAVFSKNWQEMFFLLKKFLKTLSKRKKQVIFIDELPWVATKRSGFIQLLAPYGMTIYLKKTTLYWLCVVLPPLGLQKKKIVNDKGGFHNRLTKQIQLKPFNLNETKSFLNSKGCKLTHQSICKLYMIMGGIPYYLEQIEKGQSVQ